jgi:hypothetical protein
MEMWGMECHENEPESDDSTKKQSYNENAIFTKNLSYETTEITAEDYLSVIGQGSIRTILVNGIFSPTAPIVNVYFLQEVAGRVILRNAMLSPYSSEITDMYEVNPKLVSGDTLMDDEAEAFARIQKELITTQFVIDRAHPAGTLHLPLSCIPEKAYRENLVEWLLADEAAAQDLADLQNSDTRTNAFMRTDLFRTPEAPAIAGVFKLPKAFRRNDAVELSDILLTQKQRNIEFFNLLTAWSDTGESDDEPTMTKTEFRSILQHLVPELPELLTVQDSQ